MFCIWSLTFDSFCWLNVKGSLKVKLFSTNCTKCSEKGYHSKKSFLVSNDNKVKELNFVTSYTRCYSYAKKIEGTKKCSQTSQCLWVLFSCSPPDLRINVVVPLVSLYATCEFRVLLGSCGMHPHFFFYSPWAR